MRLNKVLSSEKVTLQRQNSSSLEFRSESGARLTVAALEEDLIRVQICPDGQPRLPRTWMLPDKNANYPLEGRDRDDLSPFSRPDCEIKLEGNTFTLKTQFLEVEIQTDPFRLIWRNHDGEILAEDAGANAYTFAPGVDVVSHCLLNHAGERYFGFGEVSGCLDHAGQKILLKNHDALGYNARRGSPLYKHFPFYITYQPGSRIAFGLFYDNLATTCFDLTHRSTRHYQAAAGDIEYYFIDGPSIAEVVQKFSRLSGRMNLPPRWSLGYLGSTMSYTEAADAQVQLAKFANDCQRYRIPCDLFHLSSGYTLGNDGKRYVFTWNNNRIPEPRQLVEDFHQHGIHLAANIKPAMLTTHPRFYEVSHFGGFIRTPQADASQIFDFWGGKAAALDFSNPLTAAWWKQQMRDQLLDLGIDSTWNDNNEFEVKEENASCYGFGDPFAIKYVRPLQTLWMMRSSYTAQVEKQPNERPFLISRSGCPGMQRYVQTWSGDNFTSWQTLKYNIPMGLGLGLSGVANTGHDVGGFTGPKPSPELFVRWVQNGIFQPRFTIHSWKGFGITNEPWMYPQMLSIIHEAFDFRYQLIPYLYSLMVRSSLDGSPIIRPLVYQFPGDPRCTDESFDFMLGPALLVASVTSPRVRRRKVYLPAGQNWYNFYTGEVLSGGKTHRVEAPIQHIPLFVPEGGLLPLGAVVAHGFAKQDSLRQILLFPSAGECESALELFEDDGHSLNYLQGEQTRVNIFMRSSSSTIDLTVTLDPYGYLLPYPQLEFILPAAEKRKLILVGSHEMERDYQGRLHLLWPIPER